MIQRVKIVRTLCRITWSKRRREHVLLVGSFQISFVKFLSKRTLRTSLVPKILFLDASKKTFVGKKVFPMLPQLFFVLRANGWNV